MGRGYRRTLELVVLVAGGLAAQLASAGCTLVHAYPAIEREDCGNLVDDDGDLLADGADPECDAYGRPCAADPSVCTAQGLACGGDDRCGATCAGGEPCLAGWTCGSDRVCACAPCVERCNELDDDCDGRVDESTCAFGETCVAGECACEGEQYFLGSGDLELDLLFVIDDSASLESQRDALRLALPRAIRGLVTGDIDDDGERDAAAIDRIHVAVVTTDLGVGDVDAPTCSAGLANDGVLGAGTECPDQRVFDFDALRDRPDDLAARLDCALQIPSGGCGFASPLEAALKALSPAEPTEWTREGYVPPVFRGGPGHGAEAPGLGRAASTLAIVLVTDGVDCSTTDTDLYSYMSTVYGAVGLNVRCAAFPDALHPIRRYVEGLLALRRDPRQVVFAAIAGMPLLASGEPPSHVLAFPEMSLLPDATGGRLVPACTASERAADPARRVVEAAAGIECGGGTAVLSSICADDYNEAFGSILRAISAGEDRRVCISAAR